METTIVAIATPHAIGGISIIRISGKKAIHIGNKIFKIKKRELKDLKGYMASYGKIIIDKNEVDDGICIVYRSPNSYTGEDVVEICCHGGMIIADIILKECIKQGARLATPGEFTKRAYLNDKMNLTEAEAINEIIKAKSKVYFKCAYNAKKGELYNKIDEIKLNLLEILTKITVTLDYPEEDKNETNNDQIYCELNKNYNKLLKLKEMQSVGRVLQDGVKTIILGKPNVGKSTLMNLMTNTNKSIVTNIEGTTRDLIDQTIIIEGIPFTLIDSAGIRDTQDEIEKIGVKRTKDEIKNSDLKLIVFDGSTNLTQEDYNIIDLCGNTENNIYVINKTDIGVDDSYKKLNQYNHVIYANKYDKKSINNIKQTMLELSRLKDIDLGESIAINERQFEVINNAINKLKYVIKSFTENITIDIISVEIESVVEILMELTGENVTETVVDRIFKDFCVGK